MARAQRQTRHQPRTAGRRDGVLPARLLLALAVFAACTPASAIASGERYRVEVIVFRNLDVAAAPDRSTDLRRFSSVYELADNAPAEVPVQLEKEDGSFANIWSRLSRLADYEPLLRLTFEQSMYDYHPPVRVHDDTVMGRELHDWQLDPALTAALPVDEPAQRPTVRGSEDREALTPPGVDRMRVATEMDTVTGPDAADSDASADDFPLSMSHEHLLYQLDGAIQLRRSRFLHIDLDLEYRLPGPAWTLNFPSLSDDRLEPGFEWVPGTAPAQPDSAADRESREAPALTAAPAAAVAGVASEPQAAAVPFELHRLAQSRQIRSNTLQYFDSAFLGAIVRVTPIADETL